jgi:hypothetical protein
MTPQFGERWAILAIVTPRIKGLLLQSHYRSKFLSSQGAKRPMATTTANDWLMKSEVARLAQVTPVTVKFWADRGQLKAIRTPNGVRLFRRSDVERFLLARRANARGALKGR